MVDSSNFMLNLQWLKFWKSIKGLVNKVHAMNVTSIIHELFVENLILGDNYFADCPQLLATVKSVAHMNQHVVHMIIVIELPMDLLKKPTADSFEVLVGFVT
ncbi:pre-mRNA-splicing factor CWC22-like protein, putative [Medicago truncatula]|uniref:Pre-mRNA-splicing factor CWC22-like protein, putative n=1 Tax=Medicago truncatula TaxID=3880 RepID=G7IWA0_MEDTR|nr:pre-mRNA-splicing factor CWC22-like protein, putative [Medicago truncatula]